jgi:pyridoxal 5'-phosphate synthase pdxT subunit
MGRDAPPFHGVFIRAPVVESAGDAVEVLAVHEGRPVLARQGRITVASFHPELTADHRLHAKFVERIYSTGYTDSAQ